MLKAIAATTLAVTLVGCSRVELPVRAHKQAVSLDEARAQSDYGAAPEFQADPKLSTVADAYANRFTMAGEIDSAVVSDARLLQIVGSLSPAILDSKYTRNPRLQSNVAFTTVLGFFNAAILKLSDRNSSALKSQKILERYEDFVFSNCPDSLATCRNLPFFASDPASASVLLLIARDSENKLDQTRAKKGPQYLEAARKLLKLFRTIYAVSNATFNDEYYLSYVKYSDDIANYLSSLNAQERKERDQDLRQHQQFLNTALVLIRSQKTAKSRAAYCQFISAQKPYTLNASQTAMGGSKNARQMISEFIRCATEHGSLESEIAKHLSNERVTQQAARIEDPAAIKDISYYYALNYLKRTPEILNNLSIKDDQRGDLAFFVIDRLFYEAIDQKLAVEFWRHISQVDSLELLQFVENYVKVQTAYTLKATYAIVAKVISSEYARHGLSGDLYTRIVEKVNQSTQFEWEILKRRVGFLRAFMVPIFDEQSNRTSLGDRRKVTERYDSLKEKLEALDEHLNYVATSPIMLVMSYYMSKAPGQIKIFISWLSGTNQWISMDGSDALSKFFDGQKNWIRFFSYGTPDFEFDQHQLKHVFDFALRTGLFDTIPMGLMAEDQPHLRISSGDQLLNGEWLFFRQLIDSRIRRHLSGAQRKIDDLDRTLGNQEFVERFNSLCDDPLATPLRLTLDQIVSSPFMSDSAMKSGVEQIYKLTGSYRLIETERRQIEDLRKLLHEHFFGSGAEKRLSPAKLATRQQMIDLIDGELEKYYRTDRDLYRRMLAADAALSKPERNCFMRLHKAELLRQNSIYRANVGFFSEVHASIMLLRMIPEDLSLETPSYSALLAFAEGAIAQWRSSAEASTLGPAVADDLVLRMRRGAQIAFSAEAWEALAQVPGSDFKSQPAGTQANLAISARFAPHNTKPVFVKAGGKAEEYGIYVDGLESYARSGVYFQARTEVSRSGFRHGKRDTLLRVRRQLQTLKVDAVSAARAIGLPEPRNAGEVGIAPALEIPLGTFAELANNHLFTSSDLATVAFSVNPTAFVKDAMSHFAGDNRDGNQFISWHSSPETYGLNYLKLRLSFLKELAQLGPREVSEGGKRRCEVDAWFDPIMGGPECKIHRVGAKQLLDETLALLALYQVTPEEREILEWIGRPGRYHEAAASHFYLADKEDAAEWLYLERYYKLNYVGQEATRGDGKPILADRIDGRNEIEEFKDSTRLVIRPDRHLFPLSPYVFQFARDRVRKSFVRQLETAAEFEELALDIEDSREDFGNFVFEQARNVRTDSRYLDGHWRYVSVNKRKSGPRAGTPIYLRDDAEGSQAWFRRAVQGFVVNDSGCEALPRLGDPDFGTLPETAQTKLRSSSECKDRFEIWQSALDQIRTEARIQRRTGR